MRLEDLLHEQASQAPLEPATLASVTRRARTMRRRRTAVTAVGAVAAVGVLALVPTAIGGHGEDQRPQPATATPSTTAPTPGPTQAGVAPVRVQPSAAHQVEQTFNDALRVPYWADGQLIAPDGTATPAPDQPLSLAYDPGSATWALTLPGNTAQVVLLDRAGHRTALPADSFPQGVAYDPADGLVRIARDGARWTLVTTTRTFDLGTSLTNASIDGFQPGGDVRLTLDDRSKVAHMRDGSVTDGDGPALHTSADGRYAAVLGDPSHQVPGSQEWDADGATGTIRILDARTGTTRAAYLAPTDGFFGPWAWEGDDIVTLVFERSAPTGPDGRWSLVRLGTTGYQVGRSASWPGRIDLAPYVFETNATSAAVTAP